MPLLYRHSDTPPGAIHTVDGELERIGSGAVAKFRAVGDVSRLVIPPRASAVRTDGLWKTTCFEVFAGDEGATYSEYNLSPSGAWAAYSFDGYRLGMAEKAATVEIDFSSDINGISLIAKIDSEFLLPANVGLAAVLQEADGILRYWSTAFAPGKADFHAAEVRSLLFDGVSAE